MADRLKSQQKYKDHLAYGKAHPSETYAAIKGLRPWEQDETTLVHAVAMAINEAYQLGLKGKPLPEPDFENFNEKDTPADGVARSPVAVSAKPGTRSRPAPVAATSSGADAGLVRRTRTPVAAGDSAVPGVASRPVRTVPAARQAGLVSAPVRRMRGR